MSAFYSPCHRKVHKGARLPRNGSRSSMLPIFAQGIRAIIAASPRHQMMGRRPAYVSFSRNTEAVEIIFLFGILLNTLVLCSVALWTPADICERRLMRCSPPDATHIEDDEELRACPSMSPLINVAISALCRHLTRRRRCRRLIIRLKPIKEQAQEK